MAIFFVLSQWVVPERVGPETRRALGKSDGRAHIAQFAGRWPGTCWPAVRVGAPSAWLARPADLRCNRPNALTGIQYAYGSVGASGRNGRRSRPAVRARGTWDAGRRRDPVAWPVRGDRTTGVGGPAWRRATDADREARPATGHHGAAGNP